MRPRIRYLNGCIELETLGIPEYERVLKRNPIFTRHPTKYTVFFFFKNHKGVELWRKHKKFFKKYWDVSKEVEEELDNWKDYTEQTPKIKQHFLDGIILKDYQQKAVEYMLENKKFCIFLGPGTGKTIISLSFLKSIFTEEGPKKTLIVTPKKVIGQYTKETIKFLGKEWSSYIDIINYESLHKVKAEYEIILYDESHMLKNHSSKVNKIATNLRAKRIYLFTGTPQDKQKHEVLAQLRVLQPYLFPAKYKVYERFFYLDDYGNPIKDKPNTELDDIIASMSYGEKTDDILSLPKANHIIMKCKFKDKSKYNEFEKNGVVEINGETIMVDNPASHRMKLKQMCNGFIFYEKFHEDTCRETKEILELENPKLDTLKELINNIDSGVIYTQFDYDIISISKVLDELGRSYVTVNGKTKDSEPLIVKFKTGKVDFMVIQAQSGNAGLEFQNTTNIIFYSLPDSFIVYDQCTFRIRRIGQKKECNYYYLITEGTIELGIYRALKTKQSFNNKIFSLYRKEKIDGRENDT